MYFRFILSLYVMVARSQEYNIQITLKTLQEL